MEKGFAMSLHKPTVEDLIRECREIRRWAEERLARSRRDANILFAEMLAATAPQQEPEKYPKRLAEAEPIRDSLSECE
jgi:hypothetical protein